MQGEPIPATVRVLERRRATPTHPDYAPDVRGLAVKLYLPDGSRTDIVAADRAAVSPRTARRGSSSCSRPARGPASRGGCRCSWPATPRRCRVLPVAAPTLRPPASYAAIPYYAIHAFKWIDAEGGARFVRYTLASPSSEPVAP